MAHLHYPETYLRLETQTFWDARLFLLETDGCFRWRYQQFICLLIKNAHRIYNN